MSLSFILFFLLLVVGVVLILTKVLNVVSDDKDGNKTIKLTPLFVFLILLIGVWFQPLNYEVIDVGYKGLLIDKWGDVRGASNTKEVSGYVFFNKYTQEVQEIPLDNRTMKYDKLQLTTKGGFPLEVAPTFTYNVKQEGAANMFTSLRSTYKQGGLEAVEQSWMNTQVFSSLSTVASKYGIEYIFNERTKFEAEVINELNKKVGKWFYISGFRSNTAPDASIIGSIKAKAQADADIIKARTLAEVAKADALRKIELAKGDSASVVIRAKADAAAIKLKQSEVTQEYIDYQRVLRWDGVMPSTVLGSGSNTLLNIK